MPNLQSVPGLQGLETELGTNFETTPDLQTPSESQIRSYGSQNSILMTPFYQDSVWETAGRCLLNFIFLGKYKQHTALFIENSESLQQAVRSEQKSLEAEL